MTASYSINGTTVTVNFSYTADVTLVIDTVREAVKRLYTLYLEGKNIYTQPLINQETGELIPLDNLTNEQLLQILDENILGTIIDNAKTQHMIDALVLATEEARVTIQQEIDAKYL